MNDAVDASGLEFDLLIYDLDANMRKRRASNHSENIIKYSLESNLRSNADKLSPDKILRGNSTKIRQKSIAALESVMDALACLLEKPSLKPSIPRKLNIMDGQVSTTTSSSEYKNRYVKLENPIIRGEKNGQITTENITDHSNKNIPVSTEANIIHENIYGKEVTEHTKTHGNENSSVNSENTIIYGNNNGPVTSENKSTITNEKKKKSADYPSLPAKIPPKNTAVGTIKSYKQPAPTIPKSSSKNSLFVPLSVSRNSTSSLGAGNDEEINDANPELTSIGGKMKLFERKISMQTQAVESVRRVPLKIQHAISGSDVSLNTISAQKSLNFGETAYLYQPAALKKESPVVR